MTATAPANSRYIIGLTGGIGSGKSAVANEFLNLGITVVDADQAAREAVFPGTPALKAIAEHFGNGILLPNGSLDRAALREIVFANPTERLWLQALLHPIIRKIVIDALNRAASPYVILESPLLLETDQHTLTNRVLVVDVPEELQIKRAGQRDNNNEEQIRAIMASQMARPDRLARADEVVDNSGTPEELGQAVLKLHQQYLILAKQLDDSDNNINS
ncbi:MAG: dephospho-CoA kinase [Porticoccaceae bacterium]